LIPPDATATPDPFAQPPQVAQVPTLDDFSLTLTAVFVGNVAAQGGGEPTIDPFLQPTVDPFAIPTTDPLLQATAIDPFDATATAFIMGATQTFLAPFVTPTVSFPTATFSFPTATLGFEGGQPLPGGTCQHLVTVGDTLYRIAMRYGSSVQAIAAVNNIFNINLIIVGTTLTIPNCNTGGGTLVPPIYPTFNPNPTYTFPYPNPSQCGQNPGASAGEQPYEVQQFDTLFKLSMTYGVRVVDIAARNCIPNINIIYIQQPVIIPPRQFTP
jgi:LysM repeat protein